MHEPVERSALRAETPSLRRLGAYVALAALVVAGAGLYSRHRAAQRLAAWTAEQATPSVVVFHPQRVAGAAPLSLPGVLEALNSASVNPRASGYVRSWRADLGDRVAAGALLAEIDAPETLRQLDQARANLRAAQEAENLARITNGRYSALRRDGWVTLQAADEKESDLKSKRALAKAAQAEVERLTTIVNFTRIEAPFDGVVTQRSIEVGQLVNAGGGGSPLFVVSDLSRLRLFVHVPQSYTGALPMGLEATLTLPEYPGESFPARLVRRAGAVDPRSGSELVEFQAENKDGKLKPGAYAAVAFAAPQAAAVYRIPASAALYRSDGLRVATLDAAGRVRLRDVVIGRDIGDALELTSGVGDDDRVIDNPPDSLLEGDVARTLPSAGEAPRR